MDFKDCSIGWVPLFTHPLLIARFQFDATMPASKTTNKTLREASNESIQHHDECRQS